MLIKSLHQVSCFNPRTHEGYDFLAFYYFLSYRRFNPRTHKGYDVPLLVESNPGQDFNPRTREGYDYSLGTFLFCLYSFNPRIHKGYDKAHQKRKNKLSALIPVSVKGTTSFITREIINDMF